jgi:hypothetical protein
MIKPVRRWACVLAATGALLGARPSAYGWGAHGHRIASRVAESRLSPAARDAIRGLLHEGDSLLTVCTWADHEGHEAVPGSASWHYVNVSVDAPHYADRYCRGGNCVVDKIKSYRKVLADRRAPKAERARALLFFVHFVEDVHQPLHVGDRNDRGGNNTQVQFLNEGDNLHRLWDSTILETVSRDEREWVRRIEPLLTTENVAAWTRGDVEAWADESLQEAKKAYRDPRDPGRTITSGDRLGRDYAEAAEAVIRLRLAQAGVRLAHDLNALFADETAAPAKANAPSKERRKPAAVTSPGR